MNIKEVKTISKTVTVDNSTEENRERDIMAQVRIDNDRVVEVVGGSVTAPGDNGVIAGFSESGGSLSPNVYAKTGRAAIMAEIDDFVNSIHETYDEID